MSRRFGELQGLLTVTEGAALLTGAALTHYGVAPPALSLLPVIMLGGAWAGAAAPYFVQAYRETYGSVCPRERIARLPLLVLVVQLGVAADLLLAGRWGPSATAVGVSAYAAFVVLRDAPWRWHYALLAGAGLLGIALSTAVPPGVRESGWLVAFDAARASGVLASYAVIGMALLCVGAIDHLLLEEVLGRRALPARADAVRSRMANGGLRAVGWGALTGSAAVLVWSRYPAPLFLAGLFIPLTLVVPLAISIDTYRGKMGQRRARCLGDLIRPDDMVMIVALGTALFFDAFAVTRAVSLLALSAAAASAWIAARDWPLRPHYILGCAAALVAASRYPAEPAGLPAWVSLFLFLMSAALTVESLADYWLARRVRAASGGVDADTV